MMNEYDESVITVLAAKHGVGDLLLCLGRLCADKSQRNPHASRRAELELASSHCRDAAAVLAGDGPNKPAMSTGDKLKIATDALRHLHRNGSPVSSYTARIALEKIGVPVEPRL